MTRPRKAKNGATTWSISISPEFCEVSFPESPEQRFEIAVEPARALQRKEQVIHRETGDIIGGFAPFPTRPIEQDKVRALAKENVPRMEISMNLSQAVDAILQTPSPIDTSLFDVLQPSPIDDGSICRIAVNKAHDAFRVSDQLSNSPDIQLGIGAFDSMNFSQVIAQSIGARHVNLGKA